VAVIPARGGSKRIPGKNIKMFCGKPMIAWPIEIAKESGVFDRIIVSTDSEDIGDVAARWGAEVPFQRPPDLSDDHSGTVEVVAHATQWLLDRECSITAVCCIYATAAFLQKDDLRQGLRLFESGNWAYVFSVTDFASSIFRAVRILDQGGVQMFFPEHYDTRSQDLPNASHDAAQFYWGHPDSWISGKRLFASHSAAVAIPRWRVQDIDTQDDWIRAELMFQLIKQEKVSHDK